MGPAFFLNSQYLSIDEKRQWWATLLKTMERLGHAADQRWSIRPMTPARKTAILTLTG